jgi:hypothetical protein
MGLPCALDLQPEDGSADAAIHQFFTGPAAVLEAQRIAGADDRIRSIATDTRPGS